MLSATTLNDPRSGSWKAFPPIAHISGVAAAALHYNCPSRIIASLATRISKTPTLPYFGAFGLETPLPCAEEALLEFTGLNEMSGFELKLSKSECGQILESVGLVLDPRPAPGGPPLSYPSQFKKDKLKDRVSEILGLWEGLISRPPKPGGEAPLGANVDHGESRSYPAAPA